MAWTRDNLSSEEKQAILAAARADPRVLAALREKQATGGAGFGVSLNSAELAALGYPGVPEGTSLLGNPVPRSGRTDYENTMGFSEPSEHRLELIPKVGAAALGAYAGGTMLGGAGTTGATGGGLPTTVPAAAKTGGSVSLLGKIGNIGKGLVTGNDKQFGIDDLIKLIGTGKGLKDLFGGDEEAEWATFEDESRGGRSLDPRDLLAQGMGQAETALGEAQARAKTPVQLRSSYVQQPPQFSGGGLPMPIGLTGADPALKDPSLLQAQMGGAPADDDDDALAAI